MSITLTQDQVEEFDALCEAVTDAKFKVDIVVGEGHGMGAKCRLKKELFKARMDLLYFIRNQNILQE